MSDGDHPSIGIAITVAHHGEVARVIVAGEIDAATADELERALAAAVDAGARTLVMDVGGVGFVDSTGLRVVLGIHARLAGVGSLRLEDLSPSFRRLLDLTGLVAELAPGA